MSNRALDMSKQNLRRQQRRSAVRKSAAKRALIVLLGAAVTVGWASVLMFR
ncbi:MAG: hypothetical protein J7493_13060 [Porphyrobacter sp.]|nr:hypothetical protein [Porphyrobacter sp.]